MGHVITPWDAAGILQVCIERVRQYVRQGRLPAFRDGRYMFLELEHVERFRDERARTGRLPVITRQPMATNEATPELITVVKAAELLGVTREAVYSAVKRGRIETRTMRGVTFCDVESVKKYGRTRGNQGRRRKASRPGAANSHYWQPEADQCSVPEVEARVKHVSHAMHEPGYKEDMLG